MQYIAQRIGIFVKQRKKSKGLFKTRFFVLDNNHNLVYSSNQASIEKVIKSSDTISEIIYKCSSRKKINIKKAKVGPLKSFYTIDQIPIANKNCFELVLDNPKDLTPVSLIIFSFQDEQIFYLHDFIKNYDSYIDKFEKSGFQQVNIVKKIHAAYVEEEKDGGLKTDISSQPSKDEDDIREKFKILSKIIAELDQNEAETEKVETLEVFEDLKASPNEVKVEEIELLQLSNGNSFSGKMRNGKPHGQGTEFLQDGTSYVGEFRNGKWHGLGYMVNSNLDMTYAEFINGRPVGI